MKLLYLDLFSGLAGDMTLGALVDLGVSVEVLEAAVEKVAPEQVSISSQRVSVHGISAQRMTVSLAEGARPQPRNYQAIVAEIEGAGLEPEVATMSLAVFEALAVAEAKIHGTTVDKVHFHEVGAWDSIADVVGVSAGLHHLGVGRIESSPVPLGTGFVETRHGTMPVPAPATLEILREVPVYGTGVEAELTTPTGAALLKALGAGFGPLPQMTVEAVGWGAGHRELPDRPNVVRAVLGVADDSGQREWLLETNIDDSTPEVLGHVQALLLDADALDVWMTPLYMKKNRPGVQLSVLCGDADKERLKRLVFVETTAIGLREREVCRTRLSRSQETLSTSLGEVRVKTARLAGEVVNRAPEFEDVRKLAAAGGIPVKLAWSRILAELAEC